MNAICLKLCIFTRRYTATKIPLLILFPQRSPHSLPQTDISIDAFSSTLRLHQRRQHFPRAFSRVFVRFCLLISHTFSSASIAPFSTHLSTIIIIVVVCPPPMLSSSHSNLHTPLFRMKFFSCSTMYIAELMLPSARSGAAWYPMYIDASAEHVARSLARVLDWSRETSNWSQSSDVW